MRSSPSCSGASSTATLGDERVQWRTVGVYRVDAGQVHEAWLVPLDPDLFDRIWTPPQA